MASRSSVANLSFNNDISAWRSPKKSTALIVKRNRLAIVISLPLQRAWLLLDRRSSAVSEAAARMIADPGNSMNRQSMKPSQLHWSPRRMRELASARSCHRSNWRLPWPVRDEFRPARLLMTSLTEERLISVASLQSEFGTEKP